MYFRSEEEKQFWKDMVLSDIRRNGFDGHSADDFVLALRKRRKRSLSCATCKRRSLEECETCDPPYSNYSPIEGEKIS